MGTLTPRMALFVEEYSRSGNGRKAALHAGWPAGEADRGREAMLRCPEVQARLAAQRDARFQAIEDEGARILDEAARVAFADLRRLFDAKGRLKPMHRIDEAALIGFRLYDPLARPRGKVIRIRRTGKLAALKLLMQHFRMWGDEPEGQQGAGPADGLAEDIAAARMHALPPPTRREAAQRLSASFSRRARFAAEYTVDFNGRAAAMRAGFPPSSGGRCQDELLRGADIKAAIARHVRARFERIGLTPGKVLSEVECIAYGSLRRLYRPDGGHCGVNEIDDDTLNSIQWIDIDADRRTVLRWRRLDKVQALDLLGRHHRLWGRRKGLEMNEAGLLAAMAEGLARAP